MTFATTLSSRAAVAEATHAFHFVRQDLARTHAPFRLHATITRGEGTDWQGRQGRIDATMLATAAQGASPVWYVAGPPGLVAAAAMALDDLGVAQADVRSETFEGY